MQNGEEFKALPLVEASGPTRDGKGRLFKMEPGKRIELSQYDQWESNPEEPFWEQGKRVSFSAEERQRREEGAQRLKARFSSVPWYAECAAREGGDEYWRKFYASRVNW